jgi:succinate dehydrogenase / fumarate reductase, membrane anchor subunit
MNRRRTFRTPLAEVRSLGSAKGGTSHFVVSRLTGAAIGLLTFPVIAVLISLRGAGHARLAETFANPFVAALMLLFVTVNAWHMQLGMRVIVEDYVHDHNLKIGALALNAIVCWTVGALAAVAVLKIALGR